MDLGRCRRHGRRILEIEATCGRSGVEDGGAGETGKGDRTAHETTNFHIATLYARPDLNASKAERIRSEARRSVHAL
jgi:hypothetical protein